jgi:hypothetical protein
MLFGAVMVSGGEIYGVNAAGSLEQRTFVCGRLAALFLCLIATLRAKPVSTFTHVALELPGTESS